MIDNKMLPAELEEVLLRVQNSANFMPEKQMRVTSFVFSLPLDLVGATMMYGRKFDKKMTY